MAKRMIIVVFLILLAIGVTIAVPAIHAHADEPETDETAAEITAEQEEPPPSGEASEETPKADTAEWLKDEFLPKAASLLLLFIGMWISTRPQVMNNNSLARQMVTFAQTMGTNKEASDKQVKEIIGRYVELKGMFEDAVGQIEEYKKQIGGLMEQIGSLSESQNALLEILKLGFGNNTELVKKGTAAMICKLADAAEVARDEEKIA